MFERDKKEIIELLDMVLDSIKVIRERTCHIVTGDDFLLSPDNMFVLDGVCMKLIFIGESVKNIDKQITDEPNTESVNTHSIHSDEAHPSVLASLETKRNELKSRDMDIYRDIIKENISYEYLLEDMPHHKDRLDEVLELIVENICSTKKYIRVAGADYPAEVVRSRLMKLDMEHIRFVFDCLNENTTKIRNIKQYLLTTLYNAPTTIGNYYAAQVQHDMNKNSSYER